MLIRFLVSIITLYQKLLSPYTGSSCRFHPTCSEYSKQAIKKYGAVKGLWKTFFRLIRCSPLSEGGIDFP